MDSPKELTEIDVVAFRPTQAEREYINAKFRTGRYSGVTDVMHEVFRRVLEQENNQKEESTCQS